MASSSTTERIRASLRIVGYADLFEPHVFSASEVARGKPEPDLFLHAARRMSASAADCLVIEDSVHGVTAARRAEMVVFGFTGAAHAKGAEYAREAHGGGRGGRLRRHGGIAGVGRPVASLGLAEVQIVAARAARTIEPDLARPQI